MNEKIALICSGLGSVWRGYERFTDDLFRLVQSDLDMTLFKGGGTVSDREKSVKHLRHNHPVLKFLSAGNPYFYQHLTYAASLIPQLVRGNYSLAHYSEPGLGNLLFHAKRRFRLKYKLLFSNGVGLSPVHCKRPDHLHELTDIYLKQALAEGIPQGKITTIPYGFYSRNFYPKNHKTSVREKYSIPADKTVILSVSAVNRNHKRIDYLLQEVSKLPDRFFLIVAGSLEDPSLCGMAEELLPGRHRLLTVPFETVAEIYGLADVFVHAALEEGFCLALVEAMCAKLPVFAHDSAHFKWMLGPGDGFADLSQPGALSEQLLRWDEGMRDEKTVNARQLTAIRRFDWDNLKNRYLEMYERALLS